MTNGIEKKSPSNIRASTKKCLDWIERSMLSFDRGYWGIYERIRTDLNQRVAFCRPDTATECMRAIHAYNQTYKSERMLDVYENLVHWLEYAQNRMQEDHNTTFPFYLTDGCRELPHGAHLLYQNDNGKIIVNLSDLYRKTGDERLLAMAKKSADWWLSVQKAGGYYYDPLCINTEGRADTPCMHLWMMTAMLSLFHTTGEEKYRVSGYRAFACAQKYIRNGRILTSYEMNGSEAWRPVSSENYIALLCFALCYKYTGDTAFVNAIRQIEAFCDGLIDESGAVRNFTTETKCASLNVSENLTDLVYTLGFAMNALAEMSILFRDAGYRARAERLASFLISIQCNENDPRIDGAWRGAYNLKTKRYDGRCNQNNDIDEGGEFSVYAGWCALPITFGMLKLETEAAE